MMFANRGGARLSLSTALEGGSWLCTESVLLQGFLHQPCVWYCKNWAVGVGTGTGAGSGKWNGSIGLRSGIPRRHAVRLHY